MGSIEERKNGRGKIVYDASVRRRGYPSLYRTFSRLTDAKLWVQEAEDKIRGGLPQPPVEAERHTLSDAIERYCAEGYARSLISAEDQLCRLRWFEKRIGAKTLRDVTPALITELKRGFLQERTSFDKLRKPQTWNRYLSALSRILDVCVKDWQWLEQNPARRVRRESASGGRVRFLSDEERERLLEACRRSRSKTLYTLVVLAISTGMRKGEICSLTWDQVDLAKGVIILEHTKNRERRRVRFFPSRSYHEAGA